MKIKETQRQIYDIGPDEFPFYEEEPRKVKEPEVILKHREIPQGHGSGLDANTVLGIRAYVTPTPNCLLPLRPDGTFPPSVISPATSFYVYDRATETIPYKLYIEADGAISYDPA
jgi:hypothetical protein